MNDRELIEFILYALRTDSQKALFPSSQATSNTAYRLFQEWRKLGVFLCMWNCGIIKYERVEENNFCE